MGGRLLSEIGAPVFLIAGTASAVLQTSGGSIRYAPWLALGWLVGASLALALGVVVRRERPRLGLLYLTGGAFLVIAGFIIPAMN
jgi:hypothetical protein